MELTAQEQEMLAGGFGPATEKAMEILVALGTIYGAERMVPGASVQIAGVSYDNLGEAGLGFLSEMAGGGGRSRVLSTLNPAGMDVENWGVLGISEEFARNQERVLEAFSRMGIITTCSCTPYLSGNTPHFGEHIAWSESSAVCYANSVIGARTNREGGPSALAASLTGVTAQYGYHLDENRRPGINVEVLVKLTDSHEFGVLGKAIGEKLARMEGKNVPYIRGIESASVESLKAFCASIATYGGSALFHMEGITPEAGQVNQAAESIRIKQGDLDYALESMVDASAAEVDFLSLGCPHLTIKEVARIAELLEGKNVSKEFWITAARPTKQIADRMGYTKIIESSGAKFAADTCCVVAPIKGKFKAMATDSAKACYYAYSKNKFKTYLIPFDEVVKLAVGIEGDVERGK
jgi:predicted aconitase